LEIVNPTIGSPDIFIPIRVDLINCIAEALDIPIPSG